MKTPKEYIIEQLESLRAIKIPDANTATPEALIELIKKAVLSKKFRKYGVQPEYLQHINSAIALNIKSNKPIHFDFPFGANKLWRLEESPEPDWAELFSLVYFLKWLKPIAENYKPGFCFEFCSDDVVIEMLNNVPKTDTESYIAGFLELMEFMKKILPENMQLVFSRVGDRYTGTGFVDEINEKIEKINKENGGALPQLTEQQKGSIELNVKLKSGQDNDPFWREKNQLLHNAYLSLSQKRPYYQKPGRITVFTNPINKVIAVGSTKTSVAKFWAGIGALKKRDDSFIETVLSPTQAEAARVSWEPINIPGLEGKNFQKIRIVD